MTFYAAVARLCKHADRLHTGRIIALCSDHNMQIRVIISKARAHGRTFVMIKAVS